MNKRGDVAFVLIVVVTIAAVLSAGMVMIMVDHSFARERDQFSMLSSDAAHAETYAAAVSTMIGRAVILENKGHETLEERFVAATLAQESLLLESRGFYERVIAPGAVTFSSTEEGYELRVSELPITVVHEGYRLQRRMSLNITFDSQGAVHHKVYKEYLT